jgi:hypothetical protein
MSEVVFVSCHNLWTGEEFLVGIPVLQSLVQGLDFICLYHPKVLQLSMFENLKHFDMLTKIWSAKDVGEKQHGDFSISKIIAEHKDSQANEGPHDLSMRPFYFKKKTKNLT